MIYTEKADCCGCSACESICPMNCIYMVSDEEGFLYPQVDNDKCTNCKLCESVCPILNRGKEESVKQDGYIVQIKNEETCMQSTSGGAFSAIACEVIKRGGVVYGAAFDKDFMVRHMGVKSVEDLAKFRNSKYVQSDISGTFEEARTYLEKNIYVCYSGTPCQIEGLKNYLGKEYEKLITIDVVCRAVPSPMVWKKYLNMQRKNLCDVIGDIRFRDKRFGYKYSSMNITNENGKRIYSCGVESDYMHRAFFSNICDRPSCYQCVFKKRYRVSDFTIWDCFHVGRYSKELDNDKGATRVLIHTDKGRLLFEQVKQNVQYVKVMPEDIISGSKEMFKSVSYNPKREIFMKDAQTMEDEQLFSKYFPNTIRIKSEKFIRMFCLKIGIYSISKKMFVRITKKY